MAFNDLPIFSALKRQMHWLNENQNVIAQNVANADTPGYRAKEIERLDFSKLVSGLEQANGRGTNIVPKTQMIASDPRHKGVGAGQILDPEDSDKYEVNPDGNAVILEEEMIKSSANQIEYGMVVGLYRKQVQILKSAMKSSGS